MELQVFGLDDEEKVRNREAAIVRNCAATGQRVVVVVLGADVDLTETVKQESAGLGLRPGDDASGEGADEGGPVRKVTTSAKDSIPTASEEGEGLCLLRGWFALILGGRDSPTVLAGIVPAEAGGVLNSGS